MATIPQQCWQIAAGDGDRNYSEICLDNNAIMMGPSYTGNWLDSFTYTGITAKEHLQKDKWSARKLTNLETFISKITVGDLIILRIGKSEVHGVGFVRTPYEFNELFSDVDGWDLGHTHRVEWIWKRPERKTEKEGDFPGLLNRGDTTQKLDPSSEKTRALFDWIKSLPEPTGITPISSKKAGKKLEIRNVSRHLFDYGMGEGSLSSLEAKIRDLCSLAAWYRKYHKPSESETVAHLVVPLLLALGWTPQRIALEFFQSGKGRADIALYANGNRSDYKPIALVEAKKYNSSCMTAEGQVRSYSEEIKSVQRLIVTDGIRYGIFVKHSVADKFPKLPTAYLNLRDLRDAYPIYGDCQGADEALLYLSAAWNHEFIHPSIKRNDEVGE